MKGGPRREQPPASPADHSPVDQDSRRRALHSSSGWGHVRVPSCRWMWVMTLSTLATAWTARATALSRSAGEGEVGPELVERDPGVEEFGLQAAEGVVFGFVGERVQVAGGVEGGLGAEAGRGEVGEFGGSGEFGVLVVGESRVDRSAASGVEVAAVAADAWGRDPAVPVTGHGVGQRWRS